MNEQKIKWQGSNPKRVSHAFLIDKKAGENSLCGREYLTSDGKISDFTIVTPCISCKKKVDKINNTTI